MFCPKSPTLTLQCLWCCFRFNTDCAAGPWPQIQDQHQGPLSRIPEVSFRGSYWHRQRDAASLQVSSETWFYSIYLFLKKSTKDFGCKMPCLLHWKTFKLASAETAIFQSEQQAARLSARAVARSHNDIDVSCATKSPWTSPASSATPVSQRSAGVLVWAG